VGRGGRGLRGGRRVHRRLKVLERRNARDGLGGWHTQKRNAEGEVHPMMNLKIIC
jgi:hypothetical protein